MPQVDSFLKTKLHIPFLREGLVVRPRLLSRLAEGLRGPLTLVTAPAGYGKTTLVASGVAACAARVAWLSLDKGDNQPERFLGYVIQALQQVRNGIGKGAEEILASGQPVLPEAIVPSLINDLDLLDEDLILVLDDYQAISSTVVQEAVTFLLDHCPRTLHLVIATRSDPPIPLARLRARGQAVELRAADLRFTAEESAQFLNELMGLHLDNQAVQMLESRTEGWIAGLQMAALSMRDRHDIAAFIAGFSGTNRFILDFLLEEVLANQPPEVQRFLLLTSILDRLCAPLCDALLNDDAPEPAGGSSAAMLSALERGNLFLVPLDDDRFWFRYHHLFADLLQARLVHLYPDLKPALHRRAAAWLEKQGMAVEAINHALAGGAHDHAARMVEENTSLLLAKGEMSALMRWISVLPEGLRKTRPWLCVHQAYALAFAGRLAEAEPLLHQAEAVASQEAASGGARLEGAITAVWAMVSVMSGRDAEAVRLANHVRDLAPEVNAWDRSTAAWSRGYAERSLGHLQEARDAFEEMIQLARSMSNIWTLVSGLMDLANVVRAQGQLPQARLLYEEALREAGQQGARSLGYIARMESGLASVLTEQNQLDDAHRLVSDAIHRMDQWPNPNHLVYAFAIQSRLLLAQNDLAGARTAILEADSIRQRETLTHITRCIVETGMVRVWLAQQKSRAATAPEAALSLACANLLNGWRAALRDIVDGPLDEGGTATALMLARAQFINGRIEEALDLLSKVRQTAEQIGNIPPAIEALVLTAIAHRRGSSKDGASAFLPLEAALKLAQPGGFARVFLDEDLLEQGSPFRMLLAEWLALSGAHPLREYALHLQKLLEAQAKPGAPVAAQSVPAQGLPEPLSQREIEVLGLIAQGLTNVDIARQLIISAGTVKAHTASIYRKLDVMNRTEAVTRARQLRILS